MADLEKKYEACVVSGVEGASLYLNNYRIAGPKPWGGGQTVNEWSRITVDDLVKAVPGLRALRESHDALAEVSKTAHSDLLVVYRTFETDGFVSGRAICGECEARWMGLLTKHLIDCRANRFLQTATEIAAALAKAEALHG